MLAEASVLQKRGRGAFVPFASNNGLRIETVHGALSAEACSEDAFFLARAWIERYAPRNRPGASFSSRTVG
jgi:hypothetical protein